MRARLAVASDALGCEDLPMSAANLVHRLLAAEINAHGSLIFSDSHDLAAFLHAVQTETSIPADARKAWTETLVRLKQLGRIVVADDHPTPVAAVTGLPELRAAWAKHAEVAVVASAACASLEVPSTGLRSDPGLKPDVATSTSVTDAPALRRIHELAERRRLDTGGSREQFWHDVLRPIAHGAKFATVLDRYLFKCALDIATGKPWAQGWAGEHLGWLLSHLDTVMAPGSTVRLIGQCPSEYATYDADSVAEAVHEVWGPSVSGNLATVELILAPVTSGSKFPHDRHIRLSTGAAVGITGGFDRLRPARVSDPDGMEWTYSWHPDTLRALESRERRGEALSAATRTTVLTR